MPPSLLISRALRNRILLFASPLFLFLAVALFAADAKSPAAGKSSPPEYLYRFGKNPFLPGQAKAEFTGFLKPSDFPTAAYCAKCHEDAHHQWRQSAHANAFRVPFYTKNVQILIDTKGIEYTRHCESCHNPVALFTGALTPGSTVDRSFDEDGVTCMVCHSIRQVQNTSGIGSYVMGVPAVMVKEDGTPVAGLPGYDDIFARPDLHKRAVMRDFYRTPEFCATCHKAAVPQLLNGYKWLRAFTVYDEWQMSSWSRQSPLPFYKKDEVSTCQTCHMMKEPSADDYGSKDGKLASHRFLGANTAVAIVYNYPEQLDRLTKYLQDGLFGIDFFAITRESAGGASAGEQTFAPLEKQSFRLDSGDRITLSLVIQNRKIGHSLVPEQRDFYESWVELVVQDAEGAEVYHSGALEADGQLDPAAHSYTNRLVGRDGKLLDLHQVWLTRVRAFDNTILPGRSDLVRYQFRVPASAKGPLKVTARVNYRRFRRGYIDFVLGKDATLPVVTMVSRSMDLALGDNAAAEAQNPSDSTRWNNYGIALLDQQQYRRAADAFAQVIALKPDYIDGYVNLALANFLSERYEPATQALAKAFAIDPSYPRALYYQALIDKRQGRLDAAIEKLQRVLAAFPRLREARDALGNTYFIQQKYPQAREQYEALQTIDPDDLSAHNSLILIYRRLGMKEKAAAQAAYFQDRKNDPAAANLALEWLRKNPDVANESVRWHVHGEHPAPLPAGHKPVTGDLTGAQ